MANLFRLLTNEKRGRGSKQSLEGVKEESVDKRERERSCHRKASKRRVTGTQKKLMVTLHTFTCHAAATNNTLREKGLHDANTG